MEAGIVLPGMWIKYTTDGFDPTIISKTYDPAKKPVVTKNCTIKAMAMLIPLVDSEITTVVYTLK